MKRTNFHSHTTRCLHASGSDEAYVLAAIKGGYSELGFSDHSPWPYEDGFVSSIRMPLSQYQDYLDSAHALQAKYRGQINLRVGLEAEYYPQHHGWLTEQKDSGALDYVILGSHFDAPEEPLYFGGNLNRQGLYRYAKHTIRGMETGLFCALAHPELFMVSLNSFDADCEHISRDLIQAAKALNLPLEYNLSGLYPMSWRTGLGYPLPQFWQMVAEDGAAAIIGLDAHNPERYADTQVYDKAAKDLADLGIKRLESLPCLNQKQAETA